MIVAGTLATVWWYVVIHQQAAVELEVTGVQQLGTPEVVNNEATPAELGPALEFYLWFWGITAVCALMQVRYYWRSTRAALDRETADLVDDAVGILTVVVLAVILFGICTATSPRRRRFWRVPAGGASPHARLGAHQAGGVPDGQDHRHGVLAVRRLGAVLGRVRDPCGQALLEGWCSRSTCRR